MKNIVHIVLNLNIGGLETFVVNLARKTDKNMYNSVVICLLDTGSLAEQIIADGISVINLNKPNKFDFNCIIELFKLLRAKKIDIVHTHNTAAYIYGGIAAIFMRAKLIHTEHGRIFPDASRRMLAERILSWFTFKIVAVSEDMKNCLIKYEKISSGKIQVVYNGVDREKFKMVEDRGARAEGRRNLGIGEDNIVIGHVARLCEVKDQKTLVGAFSELRKIENRKEKIERNLKLLMVGDGPERVNLEGLVERLDLKDSVIFAGLRSDVQELYPLMDVFALSSLNEGISITLLEAIASGVPVVATKVGGNPEVVRNGKNGYLCNVSDPQDMADKVVQALSVKMVQLDERFLMNNVTKQYQSLYEGK